MTASDRAPGASVFPDAHYVILASRLIPDLDGGFTIATMARARHMAEAGVAAGRGPLLLTVDPGTPAAHAAHRREFVERGAAASTDVFRNLFDDAVADPSWLRAAAAEGAPTGGIEYRTIPDANGDPLVSLPVIAGNPDWHLTDANVVVHGDEGDRVLTGFGALYRAWLSHLVDGADAELPVVVICESRQLGELLAAWDDPRVRIVHTIHTSHLDQPGGTPAMAELWRRWFDIVDRFDAVLWPTAQQSTDVAASFGARDSYAVVPSAAPEAVAQPVPPTGPRVVMLNRLAPGKRVDHAIRAWRRVVQSVPDARLDIYGDGPLRDDLQKLIDERELAGSVVLHGHTDAGATVFDGATAMVQSTAYEGQGLSALEALSRGCPVVSYDVRYGPHDLLEPGGGLLVPDGDEDALADALVAVLTDPRLRARLSAEALERARAYDAEHTMAAMAAAVRRVLETHAERGI